MTEANVAKPTRSHGVGDEFNATLIRRHDLNESFAVFGIASDEPAEISFKPGQFAVLGLPEVNASSRLIRRAYSIASAPNEPLLEFYVVLVEGGHLTPRLWHLREGDRLWMDPKIRGTFTLSKFPAELDIVMVSTGTGIAPFISMLRAHRNAGRWRRCVVIHGVRYVADLGYHDELTQICNTDSTVQYIPTVTREPAESDWDGQRGRVQTLLADETFEQLTGAPLDAAQCHVFLCGNPQMIEGMRELLEPRGFTPARKGVKGNLHFEKYW